MINNNTGNGEVGLAALIGNGQVRKDDLLVSPNPVSQKCSRSYTAAGKIELELVPQGTLAERIRAAGAGIRAFYTPTTVGTVLAEGKESREFDGRSYVMEPWLQADFALIKCEIADRHGNLLYNKTARNFGPIMAMAATTTIVQTKCLVVPGEIRSRARSHPGHFCGSHRRGFSSRARRHPDCGREGITHEHWLDQGANGREGGSGYCRWRLR